MEQVNPTPEVGLFILDGAYQPAPASIVFQLSPDETAQGTQSA
jgi:hypothetical protein